MGMAIEFGEKVRRIPVYPAAEGYGFDGPVAKLASNESPYPPLPSVIEAVTKALSGANRYPDPTNAALRRKLSDRTGVPANRIAIGNGSCDILLAAGDALLEPGAELVYAWPSFSVYPHLAAASGARALEVPLDARHYHQLDKMAEEITASTRLVIVCNPK
jgi:histidinol-phosphate aminotransferase